MPDIGAQDRTERRADVQGYPGSGKGLPVGRGIAIAAGGAFEEQIDSVLFEDVERIGSPHHCEVVEAETGCRYAVNARVVEQPELVAAEAVEMLATEVRRIEMQFLKESEIDISR